MARVRRIVLTLAWLCTALSFAPAANAYNFQLPDSNISGACPDLEGFTMRIVPCIKETVLLAVANFLVPFAQYLSGTISTACMLAILFWGVSAALGKRGVVTRDLGPTAVKIGAVMMLTGTAAYNFPWLFGAILDSMEYMLGAVTGYLSNSFAQSFMGCNTSGVAADLVIWMRVDCMLNTLISGVFSGYDVSFGLIGFLVAAFFSGAAGVFIALLGLLLIVQVLFAICRSVYIFLTAYLALALMAIISPMILPLILFRSTKYIFDRWIRLTIGFIVQPILLFVYLAMLLAAFDEVVFDPNNQYSLYNVIDQNISDGGYSEGCSDLSYLGCRLLNDGVYQDAPLAGSTSGVGVDPHKAAKLLGLGDVNTGELGNLARQACLHSDSVDPSNPNACTMQWNSLGSDIFTQMLKPAHYFKIDMPVTNVDWQALADISSCCGGDVTTYLVTLFLSFLMAVITGYIFMTMLDYLPFIGNGILGGVLNVPGLGQGGSPLQMPGTGMFNAVRSRVVPGMGGG